MSDFAVGEVVEIVDNNNVPTGILCEVTLVYPDDRIDIDISMEAVDKLRSAFNIRVVEPIKVYWRPEVFRRADPRDIVRWKRAKSGQVR